MKSMYVYVCMYMCMYMVLDHHLMTLDRAAACHRNTSRDHNSYTLGFATPCTASVIDSMGFNSACSCATRCTVYI